MLVLVPTPIGNLRDITLRALDVLKEASLIACEDTRHTKKLLMHYEISKPLISFHEHSTERDIEKILAPLKQGETVALVTDAGTPLLSDPGFPVVRAAIQHGIRVEALPGPFAAATALAGSGLAAESFSFFGFLPPKSAARRRKLEALAERPETLVFYESPYRAAKTMRDMADVLGAGREAVAARELTKKFEEYKRGTLGDLAAQFEKQEPKGELVFLVAGAGRKAVFS